MIRPSVWHYLAGNGLCMTVAGFGGIGAMIGWMEGAVPMVALVPVLGAAYTVQQSYDRVSKYRRWKREWDSYEPPKPAKAGGSNIGVVLGFLGMVAFSTIYALGSADPVTGFFGCFAVTTLVLVFGGGALHYTVRFLRRPRRPARPKATVVRQCLRKASPRSLLDTSTQLPGYCAGLLSARA